MLPRTTSVLLADLADSANERSWAEFDARYRPVLVAFAQNLGLVEDDAAEVAQETLARVAQEVRRGRYDRGAGRLRSWIIGIAKNCAADLRRRRGRRREVHGLSALDDWPDDHALSNIWDRECERFVMDRAIRQLKEDTRLADGTIRAFELLALEGKTPADVAGLLGISRNEVYLAKHRCLAALRDILSAMRQAFELESYA